MATEYHKLVLAASGSGEDRAEALALSRSTLGVVADGAGGSGVTHCDLSGRQVFGGPRRRSGLANARAEIAVYCLF